jgi:hypothetical protein
VSRPCPRPLADERLLDWWTGELSGAERRALEQHLLACDACSKQATALVAIAGDVSALVRAGELPGVLLPDAVERLRSEGRRLREYRVEPGSGVQCTVSPDDDVVLARLVAELGDVSHLDLVSRVDDGPEQRLADLPFDPTAGELILAPSAAELRARPAHVVTFRLLAIEPAGERLLGEYTFDHTPWPGPSAKP